MKEKSEIKSAPNEKKTLKEKIENKKEQSRIKHERFQLILAFLGAIYFVINLFLKNKKTYIDSTFYPFILGCTIAYVLMFIIFVIMHRNNSKDIKKDTKNFKSTIKLVKLIMNLLFIASSLLIFIESVNGLSTSSGLLVVLETIISGLFLVIKLISTIKKIVKIIKNKNKAIKKENEKQVKSKKQK